MDACHQKNSKPEPKFRRHEGHVVLRGNVVKDDAGSKLKKQGSSASQMTAEKVLDIICRLFYIRRLSKGRSISMHPSQFGGRSEITRNFRDWDALLAGFLYRHLACQYCVALIKTPRYRVKGIWADTHQCGE